MKIDMENLELFIYKKLLLSFGCQRDGCSPYPFWELIYDNEKYDNLILTIWGMERFEKTIEIVLTNTRPEDLFIESENPINSDGYIPNWELIRYLENNKTNEEDSNPCIGISVENEKKIKLIMKSEIKEFITGKCVTEKGYSFLKDGRKEPKTKSLPSYMISRKDRNFLIFSKQKASVLNGIYTIYNETKNDIIVLNLNLLQYDLQHTDVLRALLAIEFEKYIEMLELGRIKKDGDVYVRIRILDKYKNELEKALKTKDNNISIEFSYDPQSGTGEFKGKRFRLTDGTLEYKLFNKCYENSDLKVERSVVESILGIERKQGVDVAGIMSTLGEIDGNSRTRNKSSVQSTSTSKINDVVKKIRKKTGLNTQELILNLGNVTFKK